MAKREAERTVIQAQAEAQAAPAGRAHRAEVMRAKGYNEKDVLQAEVQKAYAAGLGQMGSNGGSGGALGDVAGLGVALGAMGGIMGMTREAMAPCSEGCRNRHLPPPPPRAGAVGPAPAARVASPPTSAPTAAASARPGGDLGLLLRLRRASPAKFCPECGTNALIQPAGDLGLRLRQQRHYGELLPGVREKASG